MITSAQKTVLARDCHYSVLEMWNDTTEAFGYAIKRYGDFVYHDDYHDDACENMVICPTAEDAWTWAADHYVNEISGEHTDYLLSLGVRKLRALGSSPGYPPQRMADRAH